MVVGWLGWAWTFGGGCSDASEPSELEVPVPSAYAGCTEQAESTTAWADPAVQDSPTLLVTVEYDPRGWEVLWSTTYDRTGPPTTLQTWTRRTDGQVTAWSAYLVGRLTERTTTDYDEDGVRSRSADDDDGDGVVDRVTAFVAADGLVRQELVDDGADGEVDRVYLSTYDDQDRLVGRSGRYDAADGPEFHQEAWTQGTFGWVVHDVSVFLGTTARWTRTYDASGRRTAATYEDLDWWIEDGYAYVDGDDLYDGGRSDATYRGLVQSTDWTVERDDAGRIVRWVGASDEDADGVVDYTTVETSTWDCPG